MERAELEKVLHEVMDKRSKISPQVHADQHAFIQLLMDERLKKDARWEKIKTSVFGAVIISGVLGFLLFVGDHALEIIRGHK